MIFFLAEAEGLKQIAYEFAFMLPGILILIIYLIYILTKLSALCFLLFYNLFKVLNFTDCLSDTSSN